MKRRTQQERSAETRRLLHEATIRLLMETGYANTSTKAIAERAGVSRGAQTHHYPDKLSLIVAATEDMFTNFADALDAAADQVCAGHCDLDGFLDRIWQEMLTGDWFYSSLEIIVAARGDAELRVQLEPLILQLHQRFEATWTGAFMARPGSPLQTGTLMNLTMNVFRGMAVQVVLRRDPVYLRDILDTLKALLGAHVLPAAPAGS